MSLVTAGLIEVFGVKLLDYRIFVRLTKFVLRVRAVNRFRAKRFDVESRVDLVGRNDWLSAAVYATAGASHNLDELVLALAGFDLFEKFAGVCKRMSDRNLDFGTVHIDFRRLDTLGAANRFVVHGRRFLTGDDFVHGTERGFHNAAGRAEDKSRTRADSERSVELFVCEHIVFDTETLDKASRLAGGKNHVYVGIAACVSSARLISVFLAVHGITDTT